MSEIYQDRSMHAEQYRPHPGAQNAAIQLSRILAAVSYDLSRLTREQRAEAFQLAAAARIDLSPPRVEK